MTTRDPAQDPNAHCWEAALDGELSDEVRGHIASCRSCSELVERLPGAAMVIQSEIPPPPPGLDVRVLTTLERERQSPSRPASRPRRRRLPWLGMPRSAPRRIGLRVAAVGALALGVLAVGLVVVAPSGLVTGTGRAATVPISPLSAQCSGGNRIVVAGVWSGREATEFARTLGRFQEQTGIQVSYAWDTRLDRDGAAVADQEPLRPRRRAAPAARDDGRFRPHAARLQPLGPIAARLVHRNYTRRGSARFDRRQSSTASGSRGRQVDDLVPTVRLPRGRHQSPSADVDRADHRRPRLRAAGSSRSRSAAPTAGR